MASVHIAQKDPFDYSKVKESNPAPFPEHDAYRREVYIHKDVQFNSKSANLGSLKFLS